MYNITSGGGKVSEKDRRTDLFIPVTVAQQIINTYNYDGFTVMGQKGVSVTEPAHKIKHYFEKNYRSKEYQEISSCLTSFLTFLSLY